MLTTQVLVVEDEAVVALDISRRLERLGYGVVGIASNGEEAVSLDAKHQPDLVMMDIRLGKGMDGIQAAQTIRDKRSVPVIYLTAYSDKETLDRAKLTEPFGYLLKPFHEESLRSTIEMALFKHQMEHRLRFSEQKYRSLFNSLVQGIAVHDIIYDRQGLAVDYVIQDVNPAYEALTGNKRENVLDVPATVLYQQAPPPQLKMYAEVAATGRPVFYEEYHPETHKHFAVAVFSPAPCQFAFVLTDITSVRETEKAYRSVVENSLQGFALLQDKDIVFVNQALAQILGYSIQDLEKLSCDEVVNIVHPEERQFIWQEYRKIAAGQASPASKELRVIRADGSSLWVEVFATCTEHHGKPAVQIAMIDIHQRKQEEQQRLQLALERERVKLLADFISDASHEFKSPLSVMKTHLYLLRKANDTLASVDHLNVVNEQLDYLDQLLQSMMKLVRLDQKPDLEMDVVNVNVLLQQLEPAIRDRLARKNLRLLTAYTSKNPTVSGDEQELRNAIGQVLDNALLYTPAGGSISIVTRVENGEVLVEISDTGIGISESDLPLVFERFFRADRARTERHAGLGLSIAQKIIELHGAQIKVQSKDGEGSVFQFILPLMQ